MSRAVRSTARVVGFLLAFSSITAMTAGAPRERPADPIDRELLRIRGMLQNAEMKLNNDVGGLGTATGAGATPVRQCCTPNLTKIGQALVGLQRETDRLKSCYDLEERTTAYPALEFFKDDVDAFARAMLTFADATDKETAEGVFLALVRGFKQMQETAEDVARCGEAPPPTSPTGQ